MKRLIFGLTCAIACASFAVETGDKVLIEDQEYLLIHIDDWAKLTNRVQTIQDIAAARWEQLNATESGRTAAHGQRKHTTITNGTITVEYEDGYKRTETTKENAKPRAKTITERVEQQLKTAKRTEFDRIRDRRKMILSTTNEVTVTIGR